MSIAAMQRVRAYRSLKGAEKLVMIGIADVANDAGVGWIKVADLAEWASIEVRSVSRILARLESAGYIERRIGMGGFHDHKEALRPNLYTILPEPQESAPELSTGVTGGSPLPPDRRVTPPPDPTVTPPPDPPVTPHNNVHSTSLQQYPPTPLGGVPGFAEVFAAYPVPANRLAAEKAWQELNPDEQLSRQILDAIHAQRDLPEWQPHPSRTLPHLKTYLRNKRWLDVKPRVVAQAVPVVPSAPVVPMPDHIRKRLGELRGRGGDAERAAA